MHSVLNCDIFPFSKPKYFLSTRISWILHRKLAKLIQFFIHLVAHMYCLVITKNRFRKLACCSSQRLNNIHYLSTFKSIMYRRCYRYALKRNCSEKGILKSTLSHINSRFLLFAPLLSSEYMFLSKIVITA